MQFLEDFVSKFNTVEYGDEIIPKLYYVRNTDKIEKLENPKQVISDQMDLYLDRIKPGQKIGLALSSRGIDNYAIIVKVIIDKIKEAGATPFMIPAMGSHGGGTAEGQVEYLSGSGITEETMGCKFLSSMETIDLGTIEEGTHAYFDKNASTMDGIIMCNRVKLHTDFFTKYGSGCVKQMVIGFGKQKGANELHHYGVYGLSHLIPKVARVIWEKMPIIMGVAILENANDKTAKIEVMPREKIFEREPELLLESADLMGSLPCDNLDVVILQEMGKDISGTGLDPNIIGRKGIPGVAERGPRIYRIGCLDITEKSHNNALGVGICDIITKRFYDKIDIEATYMNTLTSRFIDRARIPIVVKNDKQVITLALNCCNRFLTKEDARFIMAKNTLQIRDLIVSEALIPEIRKMDNYEVVGQVELKFDENGDLVRYADGSIIPTDTTYQAV